MWPLVTPPGEFDSLAAFVAAVGLVLAGAYVAARGGYRTYRHLRVAGDYEPVEATVVESTIEYRYRPVDHNREVPSVTYEYEYDGRRYSADTLQPGGDVPGEFDRAFARSHAPGDEVTAYCDPDDPGRAYLHQGGLASKFAATGVGVTLLAVGLVLLVGTWVGALDPRP